MIKTKNGRMWVLAKGRRLGALLALHPDLWGLSVLANKKHGYADLMFGPFSLLLVWGTNLEAVNNEQDAYDRGQSNALVGIQAWAKVRALDIGLMPEEHTPYQPKDAEFRPTERELAYYRAGKSDAMDEVLIETTTRWNEL